MWKCDCLNELRNYVCKFQGTNNYAYIDINVFYDVFQFNNLVGFQKSTKYWE